MKVNKYTPKEKRAMLANMVQLLVHCGYDISDLMGRPLTYFNFELMEQAILRLQNEYDNQ